MVHRHLVDGHHSDADRAILGGTHPQLGWKQLGGGVFSHHIDAGAGAIGRRHGSAHLARKS